MYTVVKRVEFSEISPDYGIKLTKMLDYFQDVTIGQSESLNAGTGVKELRDRGMCWVLNAWQVVINRYPKLGEEVTVGTAPYQFKGSMGSRNFLMKSKDGEILACANSIWSFVDIEKEMLVRVPQDIIDAYELGEKIEMEYAPRKITLPEDMEHISTLTCEYHNIDVNNHVNNAQYVAMAEDLIPEGRRAKQIRAEYRVSAKYGDVIHAYRHVDEEKGIITVSLSNEECKPYVIVEFQV